MPVKELEKLALAHTINWVQVYGGNIPAQFANLSNLQKMYLKERNKQILKGNLTINSSAGNTFNIVFKSRDLLKDFYEEPLS